MPVLNIVIARLGIRWRIACRKALFDLLIYFAFAICAALFFISRLLRSLFGLVRLFEVVHIALIRNRFLFIYEVNSDGYLLFGITSRKVGACSRGLSGYGDEAVRYLVVMSNSSVRPALASS